MTFSRYIAASVLAVAVVLPAAAIAETPLAGVPTQIRRGFYTEMDLGTYFAFGAEGKSVTDPQAYVSLGLGYDIFSTQQHFISLGLGFSMGAASGGCYGALSGEKCVVSANPQLTLSDSWSLTTAEATALYGYFIADRLMLTGRLLGGLGFVEPDAFENADGTDVEKGPLPLMGIGAGLEWATQFDHFSLGLDVAMKFIVGPNVPGLAIAPRVKYTF